MLDKPSVFLFKINVNVNPIQMTSNQMNLLSSSDDDIVVMKQMIEIERHDEKKSMKKHDSFNRSTEKLILDKKLKDERNSSHQNVKSNLVHKEVEVVRSNINAGKTDDSQFVNEFKDNSPDMQIFSPLIKLSESKKKPVPLPRLKISKKINDSPEKESSALLKQNFETSGSLSLLLPSDEQLDAKDSTDDDVCIPKQKIERRRKKKKDTLEEVKNQEEVELKDLKTLSTAKQKKETPSKQKSPIHRAKRKSKGVIEETTLVSEEARTTILNYDKIVGIFIHRSDCLQVDPLVRHPLVKVHLLDAESGEYLKKSDVERSVSFYCENSDVSYILPLMTEVFDFKERRSLVPFWEELLVFNEDFKYILRNEQPVIILFEILDFVNFTVASSQYSKLGSEGGWHHIAWAFLKPVGANGIMNTEKQVRLQLYKPQHIRKSTCNNCDVYQWWSRGVWERYPATLYVTVKGITPPEHLPPVLRSRSALQGELSQSSPFLDLDHNQDEIEVKSDNENSLISAQLSTGKSLPVWSRMPSQSCKIPNHRKLTLPTASRGCFYVKFSNSGLHLACSIAAEEKFTIIVYSIPDGKEFMQFVGHQGLVYDLHWSPKDTMLLSASADCTACLWDVETRKSAPMQMLPHPSFVYCAQFHCGNSSVLVTGCCDHVVRIWNRRNKSSQYELIQELEGHTGFVSAVTMSTNGMIYSADSLGLIIEWMGAKGKLKKQWSLWKLNRNIDIRELRDCVINKLHLHPGGQRVLIHVRDSRLRMLDLSTASVIQWFHGALNHRVQTSACLSPCGGLVVAASEDGTIRVWNADTGEQLAIYSGLQFVKAASGVDYHPYEHMAAFASYGNTTQVIVSNYDKLSSGKDLGLQLLYQQEVSGLGTAHAGMGDVNESCIRSSTSLSFSHAELGFSSGKKKKKKIFSMVDRELGITHHSLNVKGNLQNIIGASLSSRSPSNTGALSSLKDQDSEYSRLKLASIIEKMDQVLSTTPSKSSQQMSESFRNLDSKLSINSPNK